MKTLPSPILHLFQLVRVVTVRIFTWNMDILLRNRNECFSGESPPPSKFLFPPNTVLSAYLKMKKGSPATSSSNRGHCVHGLHGWHSKSPSRLTETLVHHFVPCPSIKLSPSCSFPPCQSRRGLFKQRALVHSVVTHNLPMQKLS